jgi:hypothetical protein
MENKRSKTKVGWTSKIRVGVNVFQLGAQSDNSYVLIISYLHGFTCMQTSLFNNTVRYLHISCYRSKSY